MGVAAELRDARGASEALRGLEAQLRAGSLASTPVLIRSNQSVQIILVAGMVARLDSKKRPSGSALSGVFLSSWRLAKKFSVFESK